MDFISSISKLLKLRDLQKEIVAVELLFLRQINSYKNDRRLIEVIKVIAEEATDKETKRLFKHMFENAKNKFL